MKIYWSLFLLLITSEVFGNKNSIDAQIKDTFYIQGTTTNFKFKYISIVYSTDDHLISDSINVEEGIFCFKGFIEQPSKIQLYTYLDRERISASTSFYIEPNEKIFLSIDGNVDNTVFNTEQTKKDNALLMELESTLAKEKDKIFNEIINLRELTTKTKDATQIQMDSLTRSLNNVRRLIFYIDVEFIRSHDHSFTTLDLLRYWIHKSSDEGIDSLKQLYDSLSITIRKSKPGYSVNNLFEQIKKNRVGQSAPEFMFIDNNGRHISKQDFIHSKYVLLDFWASWCIPCRDDFPILKTIYTRYRDKGFEIISISRDDDLLEYYKTIQKDGIGIWIHTLFNRQLMDSYYVPILPMKYLIDKTGKIIAIWRGGGEEHLTQLDKILNDNL